MDLERVYEEKPPIVTYPTNRLAIPLQFIKQFADILRRSVEVQLDDDHRVGEST